jgi:hypothetical protein
MIFLKNPPKKHLCLLLLQSSFFILLVQGCGKAYKVEKFKEYRLHIVESPIPLEKEFQELIEKFNELAGQRVLTYENDPTKANSPIIVTSGLKARTSGKVGLGQWIAESETSESALTLEGNKSKQKIRYSMRLEFDMEYFTTRSEKTAANSYDKQKLFFHEAGHGLEMNHNTKETSDLMYPDISGNKDFQLFFQQVRQYMRN